MSVSVREWEARICKDECDDDVDRMRRTSSQQTRYMYIDLCACVCDMESCGRDITIVGLLSGGQEG